MARRKRALLDRAATFRRKWRHEARAGAFPAVRRAVTIEDHRAALDLLLGSDRQAPAPRRPFGYAPWFYGAVPETATFLAEKDGRAVGAVSLIPDSAALGLPGSPLFERELALLRRIEPPVAQMVPVVAPRCPWTVVLAELVRVVVAQGITDGYGAVFAAVPAHHGRLFEEVFGFDAWGRATAGGRTAEGKRLSLIGLGDRLRNRDRPLRREAFLCDYFLRENPYHRLVRSWEAESAARFDDPGFVERLTAACGIYLPDLTEGQRRVLGQRWGEDVFHRVAGPLGSAAR
jgi:hypothetical protein